jgi:hypothetical protein
MDGPLDGGARVDACRHEMERGGRAVVIQVAVFRGALT